MAWIEKLSKQIVDQSASDAIAKLEEFIAYRESRLRQSSARDAQEIDGRVAENLPHVRCSLAGCTQGYG
jgi:hypothetical protein